MTEQPFDKEIMVAMCRFNQQFKQKPGIEMRLSQERPHQLEFKGTGKARHNEGRLQDFLDSIRQDHRPTQVEICAIFKEKWRMTQRRLRFLRLPFSRQA